MCRRFVFRSPSRRLCVLIAWAQLSRAASTRCEVRRSRKSQSRSASRVQILPLRSTKRSAPKGAPLLGLRRFRDRIGQSTRVRPDPLKSSGFGAHGRTTGERTPDDKSTNRASDDHRYADGDVRNKAAGSHAEAADAGAE